MNENNKSLEEQLIELEAEVNKTSDDSKKQEFQKQIDELRAKYETKLEAYEKLKREKEGLEKKAYELGNQVNELKSKNASLEFKIVKEQLCSGISSIIKSTLDPVARCLTSKYFRDAVGIVAASAGIYYFRQDISKCIANTAEGVSAYVVNTFKAACLGAVVMLAGREISIKEKGDKIIDTPLEAAMAGVTTGIIVYSIYSIVHTLTSN